MSFLFIGSTGDSAGHTLLTWAIARRLKKTGLRIGFVKPFGTHPVEVEGAWSDHDALLFKEALGLTEPLARICPYPLSEEAWKDECNLDILTDLTGYLQEIAHDKDVLIIMGSRHIFYDDAACPLPETSLIEQMEADFVLIHRYRTVAKSMYSILSICSLLRERIRGIVFNRVPPPDLPLLKERVLPSLVQKGVPAITALPEDPFLTFRSLREVGETLRARVLSSEGDLERPIASMTVGSADLEQGVMVFRRAYNKVVLLAPSPQGASGEPAPKRPVAGILMTGGRPPAPQLVDAARRARIPLLLVEEDTFSALERLEQSPSCLSSKDEVKALRFTEWLERDAALDRLVSRLRLPCPSA